MIILGMDCLKERFSAVLIIITLLELIIPVTVFELNVAINQIIAEDI
jgi:hypothetical protein